MAGFIDWYHHVCDRESSCQFFPNIYKFVMTIAILYSPNKTNWMISAVLIFVPYAFVRSLNFVIILEKLWTSKIETS